VLTAAAALLLLMPAYGSGVPAGARTASAPFGERETLPLVASERVVFFGFEGDFTGDGDLKLAGLLEEEFQLPVLGTAIRAHSTRDRLVFAVRTSEDVKKLDRSLNRGLKKKGYKAEPLHVTALSLLDRSSGSALSRDMRNVERDESKVWASAVRPGNRLIWVFHEPRMSASKVLDAVRDAGVRCSYHHMEVELTAQQNADLAALRDLAGEKLDLLRASEQDGRLLLDLYLRDVDSFLALQRGRRTVPCPDVLDFLDEVPAGRLQWQVTLDIEGNPLTP